MSHTIIAAVDLDAPRQARDALALSAWLADATSCNPAAATVFAPRAGALSEQIEHHRTELTALAGRPIDAIALAGTAPARLLHELGDQQRPRALVIGSSRGGALGVVSLGSVGEALLHGGDVPIVVAPNDYRGPHSQPPQIGVADGGTPESRDAARAAAELAKKTDASLRVLTVLEPPPHNELAERWPDMQIARALGDVATEQIELEGDPAAALATATKDLDLLIVGSRSYGPLGAVLLGAVTRQLLRMASCPIMVVPRVRDASLAVALVGGMEAEISSVQ